MKFRVLETYKRSDHGWELSSIFDNVDVIFSPEGALVRRHNVGAAKGDGEIVAEILADDIASVEITEDRILIEGTLLKPEQPDFTKLGRWELRT